MRRWTRAGRCLAGTEGRSPHKEVQDSLAAGHPDLSAAGGVSLPDVRGPAHHQTAAPAAESGFSFHPAPVPGNETGRKCPDQPAQFSVGRGAAGLFAAVLAGSLLPAPASENQKNKAPPPFKKGGGADFVRGAKQGGHPPAGGQSGWSMPSSCSARRTWSAVGVGASFRV